MPSSERIISERLAVKNFSTVTRNFAVNPTHFTSLIQNTCIKKKYEKSAEMVTNRRADFQHSLNDNPALRMVCLASQVRRLRVRIYTQLMSLLKRFASRGRGTYSSIHSPSQLPSFWSIAPRTPSSQAHLQLNTQKIQSKIPRFANAASDAFMS